MNSHTIETELTAISPRAKPDRMAAAIEMVSAYIEKGRQLKKMLEAELLDWVLKNGTLWMGNVPWLLTTKRTIKCRDKRATFKTITQAVGGDMDKIADLQCAQPWKYGAVRELLGQEAFDELFETIVEEDVKTGKPKQVVKRIDTKYVKVKG